MKLKAKNLMFVPLVLALGVFADESSFYNLTKEAEKADKKGDFKKALKNYNSALQVTDKSELKAKVVFARNQFLLQNKKYANAEKLMKEFLLYKSLPPLIRRKTLNALGSQILRERPDEAKQYLEQAVMLPFDNDTTQARTQKLMGYVYKIKKQPENALEIWLPIIDKRGNIHPALLCSVSYEIGMIYRQMNDLKNAHKYFKKSVNYGRKVKYKYNYSSSAKALKELSERKE